MKEPSKMTVVTEDALTTYDSITVNWSPLTTMDETGGTNLIISYSLEMYAPPDNTWVPIVGEDPNWYTGLTHTESGLTTGVDYRFRIRAYNEFGWGEYSDEV
jgi:hypothetical protein